VTHLRQIMLEELGRRNYAESTIHAYIHTVEHFRRHFHPARYSRELTSQSCVTKASLVMLSTPNTDFGCRKIRRAEIFLLSGSDFISTTGNRGIGRCSKSSQLPLAS
jgi:hypothetical protein